MEAAGIEPAFHSRRQGGPDTTIVVMSDHPALGRVMDACVISVIGMTLNRRRSDSRTGRRMCPVLRSRAGGTNMLKSYCPFDAGDTMSPEAPVSAARQSVETARATSSWTYRVQLSLR